MKKIAVIILIFHLVAARPKNSKEMISNFSDDFVNNSSVKPLRSENISGGNSISNANHHNLENRTQLKTTTIKSNLHEKSHTEETGLLATTQPEAASNFNNNQSVKTYELSSLDDRIGTPIIITLQGFVSTSHK